MHVEQESAKISNNTILSGAPGIMYVVKFKEVHRAVYNILQATHKLVYFHTSIIYTNVYILTYVKLFFS